MTAKRRKTLYQMLYQPVGKVSARYWYRPSPTVYCNGDDEDNDVVHNKLTPLIVSMYGREVLGDLGGELHDGPRFVLHLPRAAVTVVALWVWL